MYLARKYWRWERHFTWTSKPPEGLAACRANEGTLFFSYFNTLSVGPAPGIEPATSRSAVKRLPTELFQSCGDEQDTRQDILIPADTFTFST